MQEYMTITGEEMNKKIPTIVSISVLPTHNCSGTSIILKTIIQIVSYLINYFYLIQPLTSCMQC